MSDGGLALGRYEGDVEQVTPSLPLDRSWLRRGKQ